MAIDIAICDPLRSHQLHSLRALAAFSIFCCYKIKRKARSLIREGRLSSKGHGSGVWEVEEHGGRFGSMTKWWIVTECAEQIKEVKGEGPTHCVATWSVAIDLV